MNYVESQKKSKLLRRKLVNRFPILNNTRKFYYLSGVDYLKISPNLIYYGHEWRSLEHFYKWWFKLYHSTVLKIRACINLLSFGKFFDKDYYVWEVDWDRSFMAGRLISNIPFTKRKEKKKNEEYYSKLSTHFTDVKDWLKNYENNEKSN